ncbi:hypothetical protein NM688_g4294 [Phlebia brevispora]|uniref:Uncharacterized protein n=1 Tax=Phlebia brevispora TaxID=194682 RepID=A0ACC1T319_9APHY|nr:hypothetical protein NM688_g4294 [Phlebia brevispora]
MAKNNLQLESPSSSASTSLSSLNLLTHTTLASCAHLPLPAYALAWGNGVHRPKTLPARGCDASIDRAHIFAFSHNPETGEEEEFFIVSRRCARCVRKGLASGCSRGDVCVQCREAGVTCRTAAGWIEMPPATDRKTGGAAGEDEAGRSGEERRQETAREGEKEGDIVKNTPTMRPKPRPKKMSQELRSLRQAFLEMSESLRPADSVVGELLYGSLTEHTSQPNDTKTGGKLNKNGALPPDIAKTQDSGPTPISESISTAKPTNSTEAPDRSKRTVPRMSKEIRMLRRASLELPVGLRPRGINIDSDGKVQRSKLSLSVSAAETRRSSRISHNVTIATPGIKARSAKKPPNDYAHVLRSRKRISLSAEHIRPRKRARLDLEDATHDATPSSATPTGMHKPKRARRWSPSPSLSLSSLSQSSLSPISALATVTLPHLSQVSTPAFGSPSAMSTSRPERARPQSLQPSIPSDSPEPAPVHASLKLERPTAQDVRASPQPPPQKRATRVPLPTHLHPSLHHPTAPITAAGSPTEILTNAEAPQPHAEAVQGKGELPLEDVYAHKEATMGESSASTSSHKEEHVVKARYGLRQRTRNFGPMSPRARRTKVAATETSTDASPNAGIKDAGASTSIGPSTNGDGGTAHSHAMAGAEHKQPVSSPPKRRRVKEGAARKIRASVRRRGIEALLAAEEGEDQGRSTQHIENSSAQGEKNTRIHSMSPRTRELMPILVQNGRAEAIEGAGGDGQIRGSATFTGAIHTEPTIEPQLGESLPGEGDSNTVVNGGDDTHAMVGGKPMEHRGTDGEQGTSSHTYGLGAPSPAGVPLGRSIQDEAIAATSVTTAADTGDLGSERAAHSA